MLNLNASRQINIGIEMYELAQKLWPINRSLTGPGVRETLTILSQHIPGLKLRSVRSGKKVFDWTVPREWTVRDAYIETPSGERICDYRNNNLHLVGYSPPVKLSLTLSELRKHLHSLPDQPTAIPYITGYYQNDWGFCIPHEQLVALEEGVYNVVIDSKLCEGELNYGEVYIPGTVSDEVFLSTYICHPSMANNELSGPVVTTFLAKWLRSKKKLHYSYRIIFVPETIGSIAYLSENLAEMREKIVLGFNVTCVGDDRQYSYLPSRNGNTRSDTIAKHVLKWITKEFVSYSWLDRGSDERQYCAPGIDLPVASIMRSKFGTYPEYHTSLDNLLNVVSPAGLLGGYNALYQALECNERNHCYKVTTFGEPFMSRHNLYPTLSKKQDYDKTATMMDVISYCDGEHTLLDIAERVEKPVWELYEIIDQLVDVGLLTKHI